MDLLVQLMYIINKKLPYKRIIEKIRKSVSKPVSSRPNLAVRGIRTIGCQCKVQDAIKHDKERGNTILSST